MLFQTLQRINTSKPFIYYGFGINDILLLLKEYTERMLINIYRHKFVFLMVTKVQNLPEISH